MILFIQSTAVLHKYLKDKLKILFVTIFPGGRTEFREFSMFREIPEYSRFFRFSRFVATLSKSIFKHAGYIRPKLLLIIY